MICFFIIEMADVLSYSCLDRWALYPPGRVPAGVVVHVNEEDGDVNIETPSSLQVFDLDIQMLIIVIILPSSIGFCSATKKTAFIQVIFYAFLLTVVAGLLSTSV